MEKSRIIRILVLISVIVLATIILSCGVIFPFNDSISPQPSELTSFTGIIQDRLDQADLTVNYSSKRFSGEVSGDEARQILEEMYLGFPGVICCCTLTPEGTVAESFPAGTNISALFIVDQPLMTDVYADGNVSAFMIAYPVYSEDGARIGGVAASLSTGFIGDATGLAEVRINSTFTVMQTDGLIIYDSDTSQVGKNLFTDDLFATFPNLRNLGKSIISKSQGYGSYTFYSGSGSEDRPVRKLAYWDSAGLHGTWWRIILFSGALRNNG